MHEWGITKSVIEKIEKIVAAEKLRIVTEIEVILGKHSGIQKDEFTFCFTTLTKETILEKAALIIKSDDSRLIAINSVSGE
jgi:Zn finger protein HypA/HybF involved in hydrogenase expression